MMTKEQAEARQKASQKRGFSQFMQEPLTRAMLSTLPPCEHIEVLLQAAFESGYGHGAVETMGVVIEAVMREPPRRP